MLDKILRVLIIMVCGVTSLMLTDQLMPYLAQLISVQFLQIGIFGTTLMTISMFIIGGLLGVIVGYLLAPTLSNWIWRSIGKVEAALSNFSSQDLLAGTLGLVFGLIIANLIGIAFMHLPIIGSYLPMVFSIILGYTGMSIAVRKKQEIGNLITSLKPRDRFKDSRTKQKIVGKILDTSVIIDGRIAEICKTGFLEGPLIVPVFVLEELQHIADSADSLKRSKGRRGLDILNQIQQEEYIQVNVVTDDFDDITEVDSKLIRLGQKLKAKVVTNDYNLNKVAALRGITVLNINDLANAVKPARIPGEQMDILVVKAGKENNQGIAYLDDGTMIVVENGEKYIGMNINVLVTSVLQTSAGRMIFVKPNDGNDK
jgi:uncharacterized protein YacL